MTHLARPFAMSLNAVSKHIKVLEEAHLVVRRREGREHILSLNPAPLDNVTRWMLTQRDAWTQRLRKLDTLLQEEDRSNKIGENPNED